MQAVTDDEMRERLSAYPELRCDGKTVRFSSSHPEAKSIAVDCRLPEPHQLVLLARLVAHLWFDEREFSGASLWVTQWGVSDPPVESVAFATLERMRHGWRENRPLTGAPGQIFREEEFVESVACLVQPMLAGWDAYYIPEFTAPAVDFFVFASRDSFLSVNTRTENAHVKALNLLHQFPWIKLLQNG